MKTKISVTIAVCLLACMSAGAQALTSVLIPSDPETAGVAGASVAREANAFAVDNNAAAITLSPKTFSIGAGYSMWAPETAGSHNVNLGAFARFGERVGIGISGRYYIDRTMDITSASGMVTGSYRPSDFAVNAAVAVKITGGLSVALTGKILNSSISEGLTGTAFGADVSVAWKGRSLAAGAALCNAGTRIKYGESSYPLPMLVKAGLSWNSSFGLQVSAEADYLFSGFFMAGAGLEYSICGIGFVRAGYHYGDRSGGLASFASAGVGVKLAGFDLGVTWLTASSTLGNTLLAGFGYSF